MEKVKYAIIHIFQVVANIAFGYFTHWWFMLGYLCTTDEMKHGPSEEQIAFGCVIMSVVVVGVLVWEIIWYKVNKNKRNYIYFSVIPYIVTVCTMIIMYGNI